MAASFYDAICFVNKEGACPPGFGSSLSGPHRTSHLPGNVSDPLGGFGMFSAVRSRLEAPSRAVVLRPQSSG